MGMNADVKSRWMIRLSSGRDEQGKSYLNKDDKLCCLGVLCEIAVDEGVVTKRTDPDGTVFYLSPGDTHGDCATLPSAVSEWAGLEGEVNPRLLSGWTRASDLNDEYDMTFRQIALIIEDKL